MNEPKTDTLVAPGAVLHYDVRAADASSHPLLLLIGSPMGAGGFVTLAGHFADRTVVTYDPRGSGRSPRTDGALETTPDEHADDLHRLITLVGAGPADIFASSGGAVNGLVLAAKHPEQVRTLVAHEPPALCELPDRDAVLAAVVDIHETYLGSGHGAATAKFIELVSVAGPITADYADRPAPDPVAYGLSAADDGSRDDPLVGQNTISCTHYRHDFDALRAASTRIVVGVGEDSAQMVTGRAGAAVADRLGVRPVTFPAGHGGFMEIEGKADAFAAALRAVLDA